MDLIDTLTNEEKSEIKKYTFKKDEVIFLEGTICNSIGYVIKGEIKIYTFTNNDNEEIINIINEHELFGEYLINSSSPIYLGTAVAIKQTEIYLIKKDKLTSLLKNNTDFLNAYLSYLSNDTLKVKKQAKLFMHKNITDRVMYYLNINSTNNQIKIKSVAELARILSIPRPSLSRCLSELENKNIIKKVNNTIYIK